jgi:ABC-type uncharacterized transport system permease subunit
MCVGAYLIWGCRAPFRLLGLAVMPPAACLFVLSFVAGGGASGGSEFGTLFLVLHVGLVLAAFAAFTLAAALAALYLWQDHRLKARSPSLLRVRAPSLTTLESLIGRVVLVAVPALTLGMGIGFARLDGDWAGFDAVMAMTLVAWGVYAVFLMLRYEAGWRGRRAAYTVLVGFLLVVAVRVGAVPLEHF